MKILLVEDDEQIAEALQQVLTDKQHYAVDIIPLLSLQEKEK